MQMVGKLRMTAVVVAFLGLLVPSTLGWAAGDVEPEVGDNGLHTQPWFLDSFLELADDLSEAAGEGKKFAVIWEQRGCPYCREMHRVNLADERIKKYITENYSVSRRFTVTLFIAMSRHLVRHLKQPTSVI